MQLNIDWWDIAKRVTIIVPISAMTLTALDYLHLRPVVTGELDRRLINMERQRLIDRKKDGTASEFEKGILFGICKTLAIPVGKCDLEDG